MRVGIDISGGDFAPVANIKGAILAKKLLGDQAEIILIGNAEEILSSLSDENAQPTDFEIINAPDVITMHDHPARVFSKKPNSSIAVGFSQITT